MAAKEPSKEQDVSELLAKLHEAYKIINRKDAQIEALKLKLKEVEGDLTYVESKIDNAILQLK